jgi:Zn finger protein HypA/HybF involved in hydrogenase expression
MTAIRQDCHVHLNVADCMQCQHEFYVAQEPGQEWYRCPSCHTEKARVRYAYRRPEPTLVCKCGNQLFAITEKGIYCPNCGADITEGETR